MNDCSCIKKDFFDIFLVRSLEDTMVVYDQSYWIDNKKYDNEKGTYTITDLETSEISSGVYYPNQSHVTNIDKDSVYKFEIQNCGFIHTKYKAFLPEIEQKFEDLILTKYGEDSELLCEMLTAFKYIDILVDNQEVDLAFYYIERLTDRLNTLHCDSC